MNEHASPSKSPPSGIVPRFVRSFSKGSALTQQSTSDARSDAPAPSPTAPELPKAKINAIDRFLKFARKETKEFPFSPSSWFGEEGNQIQETNPITASLPAATIVDDEIQEAGSSAADDVMHRGEERAESEPPESDTLARRIQAMIASLPSMSYGSTPSPQLHTTQSAIDTNEGAPTPPLGSSISDSKMKAFLTSFTIMNGSVERGKESVWSVLDRLRSPLSKKDGVSESNEAPRQGAEYEDDNGSVMMYGPLEPTEDSEIEIARSEIVSLNGDGEEIRTPQLKFIALPSESIEQVFAQSESSERRKGKQRAILGPVASSSGVETEDTTAGVSSEPAPREYRVWIPSLTKISIQAMWWGFRM